MIIHQLDPNKCKESVIPSGVYGSFHSHQCSKNIWKDGYCKIHHPESVKARLEESNRKWEEKKAKDPLTLAMKKIKELESEVASLKEEINRRCWFRY